MKSKGKRKLKKINIARLLTSILMGLTAVMLLLIGVLFCIPNTANPRGRDISEPVRIVVNRGAGLNSPTAVPFSANIPAQLDQDGNPMPAGVENQPAAIKEIYDAYIGSIKYMIMTGIFNGSWFKSMSYIETPDPDADEDDDATIREEFDFRYFNTFTTSSSMGLVMYWEFESLQEFTFGRGKNAITFDYDRIYFRFSDIDSLRGTIGAYEIFFVNYEAMRFDSEHGYDELTTYGFTSHARLGRVWDAVLDLF